MGQSLPSGNVMPVQNVLEQPDTREERKVPPGWDYNPSAWKERIPIIVLALAGFVIAGYLSAYQYRLLETVWDPFFSGSPVILNSAISHIFPVSDAALGAAAYLADAITGLIGGRRRWRTMPWIVVLFGVLVGPLGAVSILLVILQPLLFEAWCTLCIASAVLSILMIGPAMDEVLASLQYVRDQMREGRSGWRAFWGGDAGTARRASDDSQGDSRQGDVAANF